MLLVAFSFIPETYAPTILRWKVAKMNKSSAQDAELVHFVSKYDLEVKSTKEVVTIAMSRPFVLLFREVIVWTLSVYCELHYGRAVEF